MATTSNEAGKQFFAELHSSEAGRREEVAKLKTNVGRNFLITPIAKDYKTGEGPCSKKDWEEQQSRGENFDQMMWDDSTFNKSKVGDVLIVWRHQKGVTFHRIEAIHPPNKRLPSWSNNVGQTDRQVLYISSEFARMNWDEWSSYGGHQRCMGTAPVRTIAPTLNDILNKKTK